jgi:NTP pyrophosphatase (non-canonical NTP hydrolase)
MNADVYQAWALSKERHYDDEDEAILAAALGLGEAGEVQNLIKKRAFHKHVIAREELVSELGDLLWYLAVLARHFGISLSEVMEKNVEKLEKRYHGRMTAEESINRKE